MRKILPEHIQKCQNVLSLHLLFYIAIVSTVTGGMSQGEKLD